MFERLLISALVFCGVAAAEQQTPSLTDAWKKHIQSGQALENSGHYAEAGAEFQAALRLAARLPTSEGTFASQVELGKIAAVMGQYVEAEEWENRAVRLGIELYGKNGAPLAIPYTNLAALYRDQGDYEHAESYCRRALDAIPTKDAAASASRAHVLGELGGILLQRGKLADAEATLKESIEIAKTVPPPSSVLAGDLSNLAAVYSKMARGSEALDLYREAYAIENKIGGSNNPNLFFIQVGMATVQAADGHYQEAVTAVESSIHLAEAEGAGNTLLVQSALMAEATWLHKLKRDDEAKRVRAKAKQVAKATAENSYAKYTVDARQVAQGIVKKPE